MSTLEGEGLLEIYPAFITRYHFEIDKNSRNSVGGIYIPISCSIFSLVFICLGVVRLISTKRPITPREPRERRLYGKIAPSGQRPPSAFRFL